jgi:hypothetical protein
MMQCLHYLLHTVLTYFFTVKISFEGRGRREGREGYLLANNQAELLLIGCMAQFDNKDETSPHSWQICENNGTGNI